MKYSIFFFSILLAYACCVYLYITNESSKSDKILEHITLMPFYIWIIVSKTIDNIWCRIGNIRFDNFAQGIMIRIEIMYYQANYFVVYYLIPIIKKYFFDLSNMAHENLNCLK